MYAGLILDLAQNVQPYKSNEVSLSVHIYVATCIYTLYSLQLCTTYNVHSVISYKLYGHSLTYVEYIYSTYMHS